VEFPVAVGVQRVVAGTAAQPGPVLPGGALEVLPQPGHVGVQRGTSPIGRIASPHQVDQALRGHRLAEPPQQDPQYAALFGGAEIMTLAVDPQLDRPQYTELHLMPP
jgi:hypothetical protein